MNEKIKEAFDQIRAEEELKERTRQYLSRTVYSRRKRRNPVFKLAAAAACFLFLLAVTGGGWLFFTPTAYISIDINPSLELVLNRFDRVISVDSYNQDGEDLKNTLDIRFMDYEDALERILENDQMQGYLSNDGILSFTVAGEQTNQCEKILEHVENCTDGHDNMYCHSGSTQEIEEAHDAGLSVGKYRAYLALKAVNPSVTVDQVRNLSMREIREMMEDYGVEDASSETDHSEEEQSCETQEQRNGGTGNGSHGNGGGHGEKKADGKNHE